MSVKNLRYVGHLLGEIGRFAVFGRQRFFEKHAQALGQRLEFAEAVQITKAAHHARLPVCLPTG